MSYFWRTAHGHAVAGWVKAAQGIRDITLIKRSISCTALAVCLAAMDTRSVLTPDPTSEWLTCVI